MYQLTFESGNQCFNIGSFTYLTSATSRATKMMAYSCWNNYEAHIYEDEGYVFMYDSENKKWECISDTADDVTPAKEADYCPYWNKETL